MTPLHAIGVLAEGHIQLPMQMVLDTPMTANGLGIDGRIGSTTADEVMGFVAPFASDNARARVHAHDLQLRPLLPAVNLVEIRHDQVRARFVTTVSLIRGFKSRILDSVLSVIQYLRTG